MRDVEVLVSRRRRILLAGLMGWGLWWATRTAGDFTGGGRSLPAHWWTIVSGIGMLGWLVWSVSLVYLLLFVRTLKGNSRLASTLSDELWQQTRLKAAAIAFGAVCVCQMLMPLALLVHPFSALAEWDVNILVAVTVFIGAFLTLERE